MEEKLKALKEAISRRSRTVEVGPDGEVREAHVEDRPEQRPERKPTKLAPRTFGSEIGRK